MHTAARLLVALCIAALAFGAFSGIAAAQTAADGQFVIELDGDGDGDAVFIEEFDLANADDRELFEAAAESTERRTLAAEQFRQEMQLISEEASGDIDRDLRVGEVTIEMTVDGETGIVAYGFRWENLARVDGDRVVLSEPFSAYERLDRELVVYAPEGYEFTSASPDPDRHDGNVVAWAGLTDFGDAFEVVATPEAGAGLEPIEYAASPGDTYGGAPVALAVSALLLASLLAGRKR